MRVSSKQPPPSVLVRSKKLSSSTCCRIEAAVTIVYVVNGEGSMSLRFLTAVFLSIWCRQLLYFCFNTLDVSFFTSSDRADSTNDTNSLKYNASNKNCSAAKTDATSTAKCNNAKIRNRRRRTKMRIWRRRVVVVSRQKDRWPLADKARSDRCSPMSGVIGELTGETQLLL